MNIAPVENIQQVRAVLTGDEWELHVVCTVAVTVAESPGDQTVDIDLGSCTFAILAYEDEHMDRHPLGCLKGEGYYFDKHIARCDDPSSERSTRLH